MSIETNITFENAKCKKCIIVRIDGVKDLKTLNCNILHGNNRSTKRCTWKKKYSEKEALGKQAHKDACFLNKPLHEAARRPKGFWSRWQRLFRCAWDSRNPGKLFQRARIELRARMLQSFWRVFQWNGGCQWAYSWKEQRRCTAPNHRRPNCSRSFAVKRPKFSR